jgi:RHS repeat-associated protein
MHAHLHDTPAHALPRVRSRAQARLRASGQLWPSASGCKTASKKISSFSRSRTHARCAPASTAPREFALFLEASVSGATHYNYYRSYQATQGRYTQNDPIGLDGGWNRFGYVKANPLFAIDPLGLVDYVGLDGIQRHLEHLARAQGDNFNKDRWFGPERAMLDRLRRGEGTSHDVVFYHHEKAEADMCRPYLKESPEKFLEKQREAHRRVESSQKNTQIDRYHPDVRRRFSDLFPLR